MELVEKPISTPTRSWTRRVERRHSLKVNYYSELRSWVQRAILEAEKKKDFNKKAKLLNLLRDL